MFLIRFALHKLAATVPVLLAASVLAFALAGAGSHRAGTATDLASQAISAPERYAQYIFVALRGDFGASIRSGQRIGPLLLERAPATADLAARWHSASLPGCSSRCGGVLGPDRRLWR